MDGLEEQEIEGIWQRVKRYLDLSKIKSVDEMNQQQELSQAMEIRTNADNINPQSNMGFLTDRGFPSEAIHNENIRNELLGQNIKSLIVRGVQRFQIRKGAQTFESDGRTVRAGQFLSGTTKEKALESLRRL